MSTPIVSGSEYLSLPRAEQAWLVKPLIPASGAVLLYGDPKVGKSFAAVQLALAITKGKDWLGFPVTQTGRVVYVQLDTPRSLWAERLTQLQSHGARIDSLDLADRETLDCFPFDILNPSHAALLALSLKDLSPSVVIIDTLREAHQVEENDSTTMQKVVSTLAATCHPAALILVAHAKKPGMNGPDLINDNRGSGYVVGRMDTILRMTPHRLYFTGRAIEEGNIKLKRREDGFWEPDQGDMDHHIEMVLSDPTMTSLLQRAHKLSELSGKEVEACRSLLRRHSSK